MTRNERLAVVESLTRLPDEELLDVLRHVFAVRRPNPEEDGFNRNRFFLGTSTQVQDDEGTWLPWRVQAVAYPEAPDDLGPDWGFCQFGQCERCGVEVRSNVRRGTCSVCGAHVSMT